MGRKSDRQRSALGVQLRREIEASLQLACAIVECESAAIAVGTSLKTLRYATATGRDSDAFLMRETDEAKKLFKKTANGARDAVLRDKELGERTLLMAPFVKQRVVGVLQLTNPVNGAASSPAKREALGLVAEQLGRTIAMALSLDKEHHMATHDPLTGTGNVRTLYRDLDRAIIKARRGDEDLAVMFVDVDRLKRVNSKLGHAAGSETLRRTAHAIKRTLPFPGQLYRFGGDEFVILMPHIERDEALDMADDLRVAVAGATAGKAKGIGQLPRTTISIGVATLKSALKETNGTNTTDLSARLMSAADRALYRAKDAGRNRTVAATRGDDRLQTIAPPPG